MNISLIALNAFRVAEGQPPFAEWRKARHESMLEHFEDEYELITMDLLADLADVNPDYEPAIDEENESEVPDEIGDMIARSSDASFAEDENEEEGDEPDALLIDDEGNTIRESELVDQQEEEAKRSAVDQIAQQSKLPSYKQMVRDGGNHHSKIDNPVEFIRGFLDANPTMTRKQAVSALVSVHGVNYSTARTQYQKWFAKHTK